MLESGFMKILLGQRFASFLHVIQITLPETQSNLVDLCGVEKRLLSLALLPGGEWPWASRVSHTGLGKPHMWTQKAA